VSWYRVYVNVVRRERLLLNMENRVAGHLQQRFESPRIVVPSEAATEAYLVGDPGSRIGILHSVELEERVSDSTLCTNGNKDSRKKICVIINGR